MTLAARKSMTVIDGGKGSGPPDGGAPDPNAWVQQLTRNRDGNVEGTLHNLLLILDNDERLAGLWWLNESSNQVVLSRDPPWKGGNRDEFTDADSCELAAWLQAPETYWVKCGDETVLKAVIAVARRHRRHPIREYLTGLKWDGKPRVERMLVDLFGAPDNAYSHGAARCFMVGAIARVLWFDAKQPFVGAQVDFMLVLEGEQGKRKSSALRALFGSNWFVETSESPSGKDFYQVIQGCWGVEIGEMDSFSKADVTSVKTAITRRVDKFRAPYERVPRSYRRECVFAGTTNEHQYLRDPTGGRRFLPVRTDGEVLIDEISRQRDQLWAEAVHLFDEGPPWWDLPADAADEQAARYVGDSWEDRVERWVDGRAAEERYPTRLKFSPGKPEWVTTDEILCHAIGMDAAKHGRTEQMRVANIMRSLGFEHHRERWPDGGRERRWFRASVDVKTWIADQRGKPVQGGEDAPDF